MLTDRPITYKHVNAQNQVLHPIPHIQYSRQSQQDKHELLVHVYLGHITYAHCIIAKTEYVRL